MSIPVSQLADQYVATAVELQLTRQTVFPLRALLERLLQHGHASVTAIHARFFYACLDAKCYSAATAILDTCVPRRLP